MMSAESDCYPKRCHDLADFVAEGAEGETIDIVRSGLTRININ